MSDAQVPPVAVDPVAPAMEAVTPAPPAAEPAIDLDALPDDLAGKVGKEIAAMRAKYKPLADTFGQLPPETTSALTSLARMIAAGDQAGVEDWLAESYVGFAGEDKVRARFAQTSPVIGQDGRQPAPVAPAAEESGPLTEQRLLALLDQREKAAKDAAWQAQVDEQKQAIASEIIGLGFDPDSANGLAIWKKAHDMSVAENRYVSPAEGFEAWKAEISAFLNPAVAPDPGVSAVSPNGAPASTPGETLTPRERVMQRVMRNAQGVGGPLG